MELRRVSLCVWVFVENYNGLNSRTTDKWKFSISSYHFTLSTSNYSSAAALTDTRRQWQHKHTETLQIQAISAEREWANENCRSNGRMVAIAVADHRCCIPFFFFHILCSYTHNSTRSDSVGINISLRFSIEPNNERIRHWAMLEWNGSVMKRAG